MKALYQTALQPFAGLLQLLPGNYKPGTRLSLTAAAHALFGISTDSLHWAAGGVTRRGLSGKYRLLGCGREDGEIITHHLASSWLTLAPSSLEMGVNMRQKQAVSILALKEYT